jgi:hypothetical protein
MPYPRAHFYVLAVIGVIVAGFWPTYFAASNTVPWQFHAHGMAASIWVALVALQSWSAHHNRLPLHRAAGKASLLLFPFLIAGLAAIVDVTGKGYVAGSDPVRTLFGTSFLIGILIAIAAYVTVFYRALKFRRKVWVHAGYLLSTPIILFESPFSRLLSAYVPGFVIRGPQDFHLLLPSILWSMALELAVIAAIWLRYRAKATPFLVAGGFIAVEMAAMGLAGDSAILKALLVAIGNLPSASVWATGFTIGAVASWAGWKAGKRPTVPTSATPQPA